MNPAIQTQKRPTQAHTPSAKGSVAASRAKHAWAFQVRNADTTSVEIDIYDDIGMGGGWFGGEGVTARAVLDALKGAEKAKTITVRINSAGGDVIDGLAIHNMLAHHAARVIVRIDALAASIASVIAMAGDEIVMAEGAFMMIHNPQSGVCGDASDMRRRADVLDKMKATLVDIYAARTKQPRESIVKAMDAETWMTAEEAKALGYASEVVPLAGASAPPMTAFWNLADFTRVPDAVRVALKASAQQNKAPQSAAAEQENGSMATTGDDIQSAIDALEQGDIEGAKAILEAIKVEEESEPAEPDEAPAEPNAEPAASAPSTPDELEARAGASMLFAITGKRTVPDALNEVRRVFSAVSDLESREAKLAKDRAVIDASERRKLVAQLVTNCGEAPATAWADANATKPAEPWASMKLDALRSYVAKRVAAAGNRAPAAPRPPTAHVEPGGETVNVNGTPVSLTASEVASCKAAGATLEAFAANKLRRAKARG